MPLDHPGIQIREGDMYHYDGHAHPEFDGHMHFWDANPENWRNKYGESWIKCFYAYHSALSPADAVWPFGKFCRYGEEALVDDLFRNDYVDMAILNSTYLYEFYKNGFNSHAQNNVVKTKHPDRLLLCGSFDPREEESGFGAFRRMVAEYPVSGLKLYTAEWRNGSRAGWRHRPQTSQWLARLAPQRPLDLQVSDAGPGIGDQACAQGADRLPVERRRVRCPRCRLRGHRFSRAQFYRRARRIAQARRFLLDRRTGIKRLCRAVGGDGFCPSSPQIFRRDHGQSVVLARPGQAVLRQRLRHLVAQVADREVHGVRVAGGSETRVSRRSDLQDQAQDPG